MFVLFFPSYLGDVRFFFFSPFENILLKSFSVNKHCGLHGHSYTNGPRKGQLFMDSVLQVTC